MTLANLTDLLAGGAGATVVFKRALTKDVGRELCAFANAGGGTVLVGVSDAGKIVGIADHNRLKSRVQSTARSADPPIVPCLGNRRAQCLCGTAGHRAGASRGERVFHHDRQLQEGYREAPCDDPSGTHDSRQAAQRQAAVPLDGSGAAATGRYRGREEMRLSPPSRRRQQHLRRTIP